MTFRSLGTARKRTSSQNLCMVGKSGRFGCGRDRDNRGVTATAQVNGVRLHYALEGEGPLVVLLHG
jgi:hypothetical protein